MKNGKRILSLLMAVVLVFTVFAGCSGNTDSDKDADDGKYVIGICQLVEHVALDDATKGFMDAVKAGLGEENVEFNVQNAQNDTATCATIANQFVSDKVDLILANATPALQAAAAATGEIPILGTSVTDYGSALQIENFDGLVGGNISGTSDLASIADQAVMITEWFPEAKEVALLYCSAEANSQYQAESMADELKKLNVETAYYPFSDSNDLSSVCTTAAENADVIYVPTDNTVASNTGLIKNVATMGNTPVIGGDQGICGGCTVATHAIAYYDLGYTTGEMAVRILKGEADVSEMPIEYAPAIKVYNAEMCDYFKITPLEGYDKLVTE